MCKINKGSIHPDHIIAAADRKDGTFNTGDLIRCEVIDINGDADKLVCGMKGVHQSSSKPDMQLGIITKEQLPKSYRLEKKCIDFFILFQMVNIFNNAELWWILLENRTRNACKAIERSVILVP